jgi:C1A family cysteine protease
MPNLIQLRKKLPGGLGWLPDVPDQRDKLYATVRPRALMATAPPAVVDLRGKMPPVRDQGQLGSCTGFALAAAYDHLRGLAHGSTSSPLQIYYDERLLQGWQNEDSGAYIRDGAKVLANTGACHETSWKYVVANFTKKPPKTAYTVAGNHKVGQYIRLTNLGELVDCLASGYPFVFGFGVYENMFSAVVEREGNLELPGQQDTMLGGHAVCCVGYNQETRRFLVRNSWGPSWGQAGYFTMPFDYLGRRDLSDDFWTFRVR